jgi:hypothetical protein
MGAAGAAGAASEAGAGGAASVDGAGGALWSVDGMLAAGAAGAGVADWSWAKAEAPAIKESANAAVKMRFMTLIS